MKRCPWCERRLYYAGNYCTACRRIVWQMATIALASVVVGLLLLVLWFAVSLI